MIALISDVPLDDVSAFNAIQGCLGRLLGTYAARMSSGVS